MYGWLRWGFVAVIALTILVALSVRPVRNKKYELFFYAHFVLVLVFLIGGYFHTAEFQ
jgi:ferric-chelate reductase